MTPALARLTLALALVGTMAIQACGSRSEAEVLTAARVQIAARDYSTALITLKEALQKNERLGEARLLLAELALTTGNPVAAAHEVRQARELGLDEDLCIPLLARALFASGQATELIAQFGDTRLRQPRAQSELKTMLSLALASTQRADEADAALAEARRADPSYAGAVVLEARSMFARGLIDDALVVVQSVMDADPKSAEAWLLRGELLQAGKKDLAGATEAFEKVVALDPRSLPAHISLVSMALAAGKLDEARQRLGAMHKARPGHPQTLKLQARTAMAQRDLTAARESVVQWLRVAPADASALQLAGELELQAGARLLAQSYLQKALALAPQSLATRLMLAQSQAGSGEPAAALETLAPLLKAKQPVSEALGLAAMAQLQLGQLGAATSLIARGNKEYPEDPRFAIASALSAMAQGDAARGFAALQQMVARDGTGLAEVALVSALLRRGDNTGALKALALAENRQPDNPTLPLWRGQILQRQGQAQPARAAYTQVLQLDAQSLAATRALTELDLAEARPEQALQRLKALAARAPNDAGPWLELAELQRRTGAPAPDVQATIEQAQRAAPASPLPPRALVAHHLRNGQPQVALTAARTAVEAFKGEPDLIEMLGRAQLAVGDSLQAVVSFKQVVSARPKDPMALVRLAQALHASKERGAARERLQEAIAMAPDLRAAHQGLLELAIEDQQWPVALEMSRRQQKSQPDRPEGWIWEASVQASQKAWGLAIEALKVSLPKGGGSDAALKLHAALLAAGRSAEAAQHASDWVRKHPSDPSMHLLLGDLAGGRKDYAVAERHFRTALEIVPDDVLTLNNLAWTLAQQRKPGAVAMAERALALQPSRPELMDTLATALAAENQVGKALDVQKKAIEQAPDQPMLRLTLARLALQKGDKSLARTELTRLTELGPKFAQQSEVSDLLRAAR